MVIAQKKQCHEGQAYFFEKRHIYENKPGKPVVEKDPKGNITSYEITEEVHLEKGHTTEYVPFEGKHWNCHLRCRYDDSTVEQSATILHALGVNESSATGYDGFAVRFENSAGMLYPKLIIGNKARSIMLQATSDNVLDMNFTYQNKRLTISNNGRQLYSGIQDLDRTDITLWIGSDKDGTNSCAIDLIEFSIKDFNS